MDFLQVAMNTLGEMYQHSPNEVQQAETAAGLTNRLAGLAHTLTGDVTVYTGHNADGSIDPTRVIVDAEDVLSFRDGSYLQVTPKHPTNSYGFVQFAAQMAKYQFEMVPHDEREGPRVFPITTCSSSLIFHNRRTHTFFEDHEVLDFCKHHEFIEATMQPTLTEAIFDAIKDLVPNTPFRVVGPHFQLNSSFRVYKCDLKSGFPRDSLSHEVIDTAAFNVGTFVRGSNVGLYRQICRIVRNIKPPSGQETEPSLRVSLTVLIAIASFHAALQLLVQDAQQAAKRVSQGTVKTGDLVLAKGQLLLMETTQMAVAVDSKLEPVLWLEGVDSTFRELLNDILSGTPLKEEIPDGAKDPDVSFKNDFLFTYHKDTGFEEELENATMSSAILWAKRGNLGRARAHLCVVALKTIKSKLAAHILTASLRDMPESLDVLIEEVEDMEDGEYDDMGHLALSNDRPNSILTLERVEHITVNPRGMRGIGVEMSHPMTLAHTKKGYKIAVDIQENFDTNERRRTIAGTLTTPMIAVQKAIKSITGINVFGIGFTRVGSKKKFILDQDQVVFSLLQGNFGSNGFKWILGALLSNKVHVDPASDALGYLPRSKLIFAKGGVLINEPLQTSIFLLNCVTDKQSLIVDWGPQLGAVKLFRGEEVSVHGTEVRRNISGSQWKRCALSRRYMAF